MMVLLWYMKITQQLWRLHMAEAQQQRPVYIGVKDRFCKEAQQYGYINVVKIPTDEHVADLLTKSLPTQPFLRHATTMLGMAPYVDKRGAVGTGSVPSRHNLATP